MEPIVSSWAQRYYYTGLGLPTSQITENPKYNDSFSALLSSPIAKLLGVDSVANQQISGFLQEYQKLGIKAPFYTLPYFADNYGGGDWKESIKANLSDLRIVTAVVKDGKAFHAYAKGNKIIGAWPKTPHILGDADLASPGEDIINSLIFTNNELVTDNEIEAIREICRISKDYEANVLSHGVEMEHLVAGEIRKEKIPVTDVSLPPYNVRKLFKYLPEHSVFATKHEQAWDFVQNSANVEDGVKEYLERVINTLKASAPAQPEEVQQETITPETEQAEDGSVGLYCPDTGERFDDYGEFLAYLVRTNVLEESWTIKEIIKWFSLPDFDNWRPHYRYDYDKPATDPDNKWALYEILEHLGQYIDLNPNKAMTVQHLMQELDTEEAKIQAQNPHDLLRTMFTICASKGTRDVLSIKNNEKTWEPQLQRQAKEALQKGYDGSLTLNDLADGKFNPIEATPTMDDLAIMAFKLNLPKDLTVDDMINGLTQHPQVQPTVLPESAPTSEHLDVSIANLEKVKTEMEQLRKERAPEFNTLDELMSYKGVSMNLFSRLSSLSEKANKLEGVKTLADLLGSDLLPSELNISLAQKMANAEQQLTLSGIDSVDRLLTDDKLNWNSKMREELQALIDNSKAVLEENARYQKMLEEASKDIKSINTITDLLAGDYLSPEVSSELTEMLKSAEVGNGRPERVTGDFAYDTAEALLFGVRGWLKQFDGKPLLEVVKDKMKALPIYYAFVRVCGASADAIGEIEEHLEEVKEKIDDSLKNVVDDGLTELRKYK